MQIGFVGLGQMGSPLATNVMKAGYALRVFDMNKAAVAELVEAGAIPADGLPQLAGVCDVVITALPAPKISEAVVDGPGGLLEGAKDGTVFVEMSTVSPGLIRRLAPRCAERGVTLVDCGMSGGPKGAADASLALMVGGDDEVVGRLRPLLETMGSSVFHCGPSGSGMAAKLVNNALAHTNALAVCEAFALGVKNGLEPKQLYDTIASSSGMSWVLPARFRQYIQQGTFNPGMTLDLLQKDSSLAMEMAQESETPLFLFRIANSLFTWYQLEGLGSHNWAEMMTLWEKQLGIRIGATEAPVE